MSRTKGFWEQDTAFPDGGIFISAGKALVVAGAVTPLASAVGNSGVVLPAAGTTTLEFDLDEVLVRYGKQDDIQSQFGSASVNNGLQGQQSQPLKNGTVFRTNWQGSGRPPEPSTNFGKIVTSRPKGIQINNVVPIYDTLAVALTSLTIGLFTQTYVEGSAPTQTTLLAQANNGLPTTVGYHATPVAPTTLAMLTNRFSRTAAILTAVAPAGSTVNLFGLWLDVAFNYN